MDAQRCHQVITVAFLQHASLAFFGFTGRDTQSSVSVHGDDGRSGA